MLALLPLRSEADSMVLDPLPASILITRDDVDNALRTGNTDPRGKSPGSNYRFSYTEQQWIKDLNKRNFFALHVLVQNMKSPCPVCSRKYRHPSGFRSVST